MSNPAGRKTVAVFVDSPDLQVAAFPFTVELLETTPGEWLVVDAAIVMP